MDQRFENINSQLINVKYGLTKHVDDNLRTTGRRFEASAEVESLESRIAETETDSNK